MRTYTRKELRELARYEGRTFSEMCETAEVAERREVEERSHIFVERCDPECHSYWSGEREDAGWLTDSEITEMESDPGISRICYA